MGSLFSSFHDQLSASQGTEPGSIDCHRAQKVALRLLIGAAADVQPLDGVVLGAALQIAQPQQVGAERVFLLVIFNRPLNGQPPACVGRAGRPLAGAVAPQGELGLRAPLRPPQKKQRSRWGGVSSSSEERVSASPTLKSVFPVSLFFNVEVLMPSTCATWFIFSFRSQM